MSGNKCLSPAQTQRLQAAMLQRESGGNYKAVNSIGYTGGYQFGAAALEDLGYIKQGASKRGNSALKDPSVWSGKNGMNNVNDFRGAPAEQDKAFQNLTARNCTQLRKLGTITDSTPAAEAAGYLAASHLLGPTGASKNINKADAYGTHGSEYFQLGKDACK